MPTEITTGVGRIVWGHPAKARNKTDQKNQPVLKDGQPVHQWSFGVAFPKAEFQAQIWPAMAAEAATGYPQGIPPAFAWKYVDGDGIDRDGKPYNQREGYAGCYVLAISSELMAPPIYKLVSGQYVQQPAEAIKCGDYVVVGLNLKVNVPSDRTHTPGLYVNPTVVELVGYGTEIVSMAVADPNAVLGGRTYALPPGASATPVQTPGAGMMPGTMPGAPMAQPGVMPGAPMMAPPAAMAPPPPVAPVAPAITRPTDPNFIHAAGTAAEQWFINGAWMPAQVAPPPAPLPPPAVGFIPGAPQMAPPAAMPGAPVMPGMMPPR